MTYTVPLWEREKLAEDGHAGYISFLDDAIDEQLEEEVCISRYARTHVLFNTRTREVVPMNCKSWRCPKHRSSWKHRWTVIVSRETAINPVNKLVTLTCASKATPAQLVLARQHLFRAIRKEYGSFEYFSVLEFTSKTRLPHLHILGRGLFIPHRELSDLWVKATLAASIGRSPVVWIEAPKSQQSASVYALSYAVSGEWKGQDIPLDWKGRKISYSRKFFLECTARQHWLRYIYETYGDSQDTVWATLSRSVGEYLTYADFRE
jgi:hypothetical protein